MRVLVTGSTGYVGSRLVPVLLDAGHEVFAATRGSDLDAFGWGAQVTRTPLDIEDPDSVREATRGVDAVVYLVHSMDDGDFVRKDREAAERMAVAAAENGVGRMVYLSGLIPPGDLSDHLRSRLEVEEVLPRLVGADRLAPRGDGDRLGLDLVRADAEDDRAGAVHADPHLDAEHGAADRRGGRGDDHRRRARGRAPRPGVRRGRSRAADVPELLALFADVAGLRRLQVPVPFLPVALVGRAVAVISGLPRGTVTALVESLSHDMVCREDDVLGDSSAVTTTS